MSLPDGKYHDVSIDVEQHRAQLLAANSKDEALQVAIAAAEKAMQALKISKDGVERDRCSIKSERFLDEAERIKRSEDWRTAIETTPVTGSNGERSANAPASRELREPQSSRQPSKQEQILLLKASYLNGSKFPPWTTVPDQKEFELKDGEALFLYVASISIIHPSRH